MALIKDIIDLIYKDKTSMVVHEINQQILKLDRRCFKADDIWLLTHNGTHNFWDNNHEVYAITTNKTFKMKSIYLDYQSTRDFGFQWTYICNKCGEYLIENFSNDPNDNHIYYDCCCDNGFYIMQM